jgi:adenylate cyclase
MSKPTKKLKGRPATDERGNSTWKWAGETEVEATHLRALADGLSLAGAPQDGGLDPYSRSTSQDKKPLKGRSLDDMRRLNEEMQRDHEALVKSLRKRTPRKSDSQPRGGVRLHFDDRELLVDERHSSITIGRAEDNDVVVTRERVSRNHARIEISRNMFVLIDQSTNGTFVQTTAGEKSFTRRGSLQLKGQGMIGLGRRPRQGSSHTIRFTCEEV